MKRIVFVFFLTLLVAAVQAAPIEPLGKSEVIKINRTELRFIVKVEKTSETLILQITSETRFFKEGKYAISEDLAVGDSVHGKIHRRADGVYEAVRIYIVKPKMPVIAAVH